MTSVAPPPGPLSTLLRLSKVAGSPFVILGVALFVVSRSPASAPGPVDADQVSGKVASRTRLQAQSRDALRECLDALSEAVTQFEFVRLPITATPAQQSEVERVNWLPMATRVRAAGALVDDYKVRQLLARGIEALSSYDRVEGSIYNTTNLLSSMQALVAAALREDNSEQDEFEQEINEHSNRSMRLFMAQLKSDSDAAARTD